MSKITAKKILLNSPQYENRARYQKSPLYEKLKNEKIINTGRTTSVKNILDTKNDKKIDIHKLYKIILRENISLEKALEIYHNNSVKNEESYQKVYQNKLIKYA